MTSEQKKGMGVLGGAFLGVGSMVDAYIFYKRTYQSTTSAMSRRRF